MENIEQTLTFAEIVAGMGQRGPSYYQHAYDALDNVVRKDKKLFMFLAADKDLWSYHTTKPIKSLKKLETFKLDEYQAHYLFDKYRLRTNIDQENIEILFRAILGRILTPILHVMSLILWYILKDVINIHFSHYYLFLTYRYVLECNANKIILIAEYLKHIFFMKSVGRDICFEITRPLITQWCWFNAYYWCFVEDDELEDDLDMEDWWESDREHGEWMIEPYVEFSEFDPKRPFHYCHDTRSFIRTYGRYRHGKTKHNRLQKFIYTEQDRWKRIWKKYTKRVQREQNVINSFKQYVKDYHRQGKWFGIKRYCKTRFWIMYKHTKKGTDLMFQMNFLFYTSRMLFLLVIIWEFFRYYERIMKFDSLHFCDDFRHFEYYDERFYCYPAFYEWRAPKRQPNMCPTHYWLGHTMDWRRHPYKYLKYGYKWAPRSRIGILYIRTAYRRYGHPGYMPHQI